MKKFFIILLSAALILTAPIMASAATATPDTLAKGSSGNQVIDVQNVLRELGYLNFRVSGKYSGITFDAVQRFQTGNGLSADGQAGGETLNLLLSGDAKPAPKNPKFKLVYGPYLKNPTAFGTLSSWEEIGKLFPEGATVTITDLYSDKTFRMQRTGGINNARVETLGKGDTDIYVAMFGGEGTWEKRPVLATIQGATYAAGLFGSTGGPDTITDNGMDGGTELYFSGSASDVFGIPDDEMATAVKRAANALN